MLLVCYNGVMYEKTKELLTNSKGRVNSRGVSKQAFERKGYPDHWQYFLEYTKEFEDFTLHERAHVFVLGIQERPKCLTCGNPVVFINRSLSDYCSQDCSLRSPLKREWMKKRDETAKEKKRKQTSLERYGYTTNSQRPEIKESLSKKTTQRYLTSEQLEKLNDKEFLVVEYRDKGRSPQSLAEELDVDLTTVNRYLREVHGCEMRSRHSSSGMQKEIAQFIESLGFEIQEDVVGLLDGRQELDIYIASQNFAVELNGIYWHSFPYTPDKKDKLKHYRKATSCHENGIRLLMINELEWLNNPELVKSMIRSRLGVIDRKVYARKCHIVEVDREEAKTFLIKNHLEGPGDFHAMKHFGLRENDELVALMSFKRQGEGVFNLSRFCNKRGTLVVGGFSKLFKYAVAETKAEKVSTYTNNAYTAGKISQDNGFTMVRESRVYGQFTDLSETLPWTKTKKQNLPSFLSEYDPSLTKDENLFRNGYRIVYTAGHQLWEWNADT